MNGILSFLRKRLDERSTWRAIVLMLGVLGVSLSPEQAEQLMLAGLAVWAFVEALLPDPAGRMRAPDDAEQPSAKLIDQAKENPGQSHNSFGNFGGNE